MSRSVWSRILMILSVPFVVNFALFTGASGTAELGLLINDMFKKDRHVDIDELTK